jgi:ABC-type xylose transport system permease subunit
MSLVGFDTKRDVKLMIFITGNVLVMVAEFIDAKTQCNSALHDRPAPLDTIARCFGPGRASLIGHSLPSTSKLDVPC